MTEIDRVAARALVEAGYMPLKDYIERFADPGPQRPRHIDSPATAPDAAAAPEPVLQAYALFVMSER